MQTPHELDLRPMLRAGGEPFALIMDTVKDLRSGQALRVLATFEPVPLYGLLAKKGFDHTARKIAADNWEVMFTPTAATAGSRLGEAVQSTAENTSLFGWPEPSRHLDSRDLDPPEPMVRTLAAVEALQSGEVLSVLLCREPVFLFPKLRDRGHQYRGRFETDGATYKLLVRKGAGEEVTA